jgi:hypothetical protein
MLVLDGKWAVVGNVGTWLGLREGKKETEADSTEEKLRLTAEEEDIGPVLENDEDGEVDWPAEAACRDAMASWRLLSSKEIGRAGRRGLDRCPPKSCPLRLSIRLLIAGVLESTMRPFLY